MIPYAGQEGIRPSIPLPQPKPFMHWQRITNEVCLSHNIPVHTVMGNSRALVPSAVRQIIWRRIRAEVRIAGRAPPYRMIARWFGRHYSTVQYGVKGRRANPQT